MCIMGLVSTYFVDSDDIAGPHDGDYIPPPVGDDIDELDSSTYTPPRRRSSRESFIGFRIEY